MHWLLYGNLTTSKEVEDFNLLVRRVIGSPSHPAEKPALPRVEPGGIFQPSLYDQSERRTRPKGEPLFVPNM